MARPSANEVQTVEVVNQAQRCRWPVEEKMRMVEESYLPDVSVSYVVRQNGVSPSLLFRWRKLMSEGGKVAVGSGGEVVKASEARELKKRICDLERMLGKKTMEVEILKDALEVAREKN